MTANSKPKKILIATPLYPPDIGGPSQYAKNLAEEFRRLNCVVIVKKYNFEKKLPVGLRHCWYGFKVIKAVWQSDYVLVLDTASVGWPTVAVALFLRRPVVVRVGGDFLWEQYVNRTRQPIVLSKFYSSTKDLNFKERIIWSLTGWLLKKSTALVFSTEWQRRILLGAYNINRDNVYVIDNFFDHRQISAEPVRKNFLWAGRPIFLKNTDKLKEAFVLASQRVPDIELDIITNSSQDKLFQKISECYAVILPSISEVSPNLIIEAIMHKKPFIITKESAYAERFADLGLIIDPLSLDSMVNQVITMTDPVVYQRLLEKLDDFNYTHSYRQMAEEFLAIFNKI